MDDREIQQWDKRLADQVRRGWDNYKHLHIDLSVARIDQSYLIAGEYLYAEDSSSADAKSKIRLNRKSNDALDLERGVKIETVFIEIFVTNDALQDEWIDLVFGINFKYKKKITIDEIIGVLNFLVGGPISTPPGIDLLLLPGAGGITQIGDASVTAFGLNTNDDFYVTGRLEVFGLTYCIGTVSFLYGWIILGPTGDYLNYTFIVHEITIAIGNSSGVSGVIMAPSDSIIDAVACRVTQAPGGGPSNFDLGRTGFGNLDEYIDNQLVALNGRFNIAAHNDGTLTGPHYNSINRTLTITTTDGAGLPVNVIGADMKVRVVVWYKKINPPTI